MISKSVVSVLKMFKLESVMSHRIGELIYPCWFRQRCINNTKFKNVLKKYQKLKRNCSYSKRTQTFSVRNKLTVNIIELLPMNFLRTKFIGRFLVPYKIPFYLIVLMYLIWFSFVLYLKCMKTKQLKLLLEVTATSWFDWMWRYYWNTTQHMTLNGRSNYKFL